MKKALLLGATGLVGSQVLSLIAESNFYQKIYVPVRNKAALAHVTDVELIETDFKTFDGAPWLEVDDVFCCLGTTIRKAGSEENFKKVDYHLPLEIAKRAKKAGAGRFFLVSSIGADAHSKVFYLRTKGEIERDLALVGFKQLHIARPAGLKGNRKEFRPAEWLGNTIGSLISPFMRGKLKPYRPIHARTVAKALTFMAMRDPISEAVTIYESDKLEQMGNFGA